MGYALEGENYCKEHQGNHSHYDPKNCTVCRLRAELERTKKGARGCMESCHRLMDYNEGLEDKLEQSEARVRELEEALKFIAASHDAGRHDGLPELCPAHDDIQMWVAARKALANSEKEKRDG